MGLEKVEHGVGWVEAPPDGWYELEVMRDGAAVGGADALPVRAAVVTLGRAEDADVPAAHPSVSRRHAELLFRADGSAYVRDLHSTHGSFVGRARLPPGEIVPLRIGAPLRLGQSTRAYVLVGSPEAQLAEERRAAAAAESRAAKMAAAAPKRPEKRPAEPAPPLDDDDDDDPAPAALAAAGKRAASACSARAFDEADEMYDRTRVRSRSAADVARERHDILAELAADSSGAPLDSGDAAGPRDADSLDSFVDELLRSAAVDRRRLLEIRLAELDRELRSMG